MKGNQIVLRVAIITLGTLSVVSLARATETTEVGAIKNAIDEPFAPLQGTHNFRLGAVTESSGGELSTNQLNKELTNPVSSIWSLVSEFNNFKLNNGQWNNNWLFQPILPVSLTKDWNLVSRPVMPFYNIVPHPTAHGGFDHAAGLGDLALLDLLSPANAGNWVLGLGPTAIFPTATSHFTGQGKWQLGPGAALGYITDKYFIGVVPQFWWSVGGVHGRPHTAQMNLQPAAAIFFGDGWSIFSTPNILADFTAPSSGDAWTVPIGLGVSKVVKYGRLPVKWALQVQYMPVRPRRSGQDWNVQLIIIPVIPKLIKGTLF